MKRKEIEKLVLSGMFLAIGMVLPMLTMQIKEIGDTLLPMHLPVLLCGFICGWSYGGMVGFILPFFRSLIFEMPPIYPQAVWTSMELMTYGIVCGILYSVIGKKKLWAVYCSLIISMIAGRIVWGITKAILLGVSGKSFTFTAFMIGGFADALPGVIIQLILVPTIVILYEKRRV